MIRLLAFALVATTLPAADSFAGRWDCTVKSPAATYPSWLEISGNPASPQIRYQPRSGSVRPLKEFRLENSQLILTVGPNTTWRLTAQHDTLSGTQLTGDAESAQVTAARAPSLDRPAPQHWTATQPLFNGHDLTGWEPDNPAINHWIAENNELVNQEHGANLRTTRKFTDFKLHLELNCPPTGNSGVYLRGRYEMQVEYETVPEDAFHSMGAIYGMVPVAKILPRTPSQWETFDVTLVGRRVTVVRNGNTIIDNQEIAGITGGAIDSNEAAPGVFYIQGDHTGGMKYRNITISVPQN